MKGDIIQYVQNEISMVEALNILVEADDSFATKRQNRRKLDDKKESPKAPHTSCFRKGYHKYERDWKRSSRRATRRNGKAEIDRLYRQAMADTAPNWEQYMPFINDPVE